MKTVLILCDQEQCVDAQLTLVKGISDRFHVAVIFGREISQSSIERFRDQGCDCHVADQVERAANKTAAHENTTDNKKSLIRGKEKNSLFLSLAGVAVFFILYKRYRKLLPIVKKIRSSVLIVNGDRGAVGDEQVMLKIAKKLGIPSFMPYFSHISDGITIRKGNRRFYLNREDALVKRWIYRKYTKQSKVVEDGAMYFYPPEVMMGLGMFGSLSEYPWMIGNGLLNVMCVDNNRNKKACMTQGVSENKLKIVGDIQYDALHETYSNSTSIRNGLHEKYGMEKDQHSIILAMPQLAEHKILDWNRHWQEIEFLVNGILADGRGLLISLHPKAEKQKYEFLEKAGRCRILDESLKDVLPVADLFVATFSSTVLWAVLCGVKTVVVDFYGFNYDIFDYMKSLSIVRDKTIFVETVRQKLANKVNFESDWSELSKDIVFDGRTISRYCDVIEEIVNG